MCSWPPRARSVATCVPSRHTTIAREFRPFTEAQRGTPGQPRHGTSRRANVVVISPLRTLILVSKTYWGGMPFWFRKPPEQALVESVVLRTHDLRQIRALYWTSARRPKEEAPKIGV